MISIGIDIGTTSISAISADAENGNIAEVVTLPNNSFMKDVEEFEKVQNVGYILDTVKDSLNKLIGNNKVCSIGVTGQMHGIVYVNSLGLAVSPLYTWQDLRGNQLYKNGKTYAEYLSEVTGYSLATGFGIVTHFYNLKNGLVPKEATCFCTIHDYIVMHLTGNKAPVIHISDAASFGIFDLKSSTFDTNALSKIGIDIAMLPKVIKETECLGFYKNIPVSVAIGDNQASFLGSVKGENCLLINVGTGSQVSVLQNCLETDDNDIEVRPLCNDKNILVGSSLCGGRAYAILENFFESVVGIFPETASTSFYEKMDELAGTKGEALTVSTFFGGTRKNPGKRGSIENISTDNFTPSALVKGFLNGMVSELAELYNKMKPYSDKPKLLVGSGNGIRKNKPLRKLLTETFKMDLVVPKNKEEAAFGAMIFSLVAANKFKSLISAQNSLISYVEEE